MLGPMSSLDVTSTSTAAVTSLLVSTVTSLPLSTMVSSNQESGQAQHGNVTSRIPNLSKSTAERPGHPLPNTAIGSNTIFSSNPPLNLSQSGNFTGSSDIKAASTVIAAKSLSDPPPITGLFGGIAVSLFASSSSSGYTSSKTSASNQLAVGPKGTAPQPIASSGPGFAFQPLAPGVSIGNTTQTTTSVGLNVRSGVLNTGVKGSSMIQSTAQTSQIANSVASMTNANTAGVAVDASFREKSTPSSGVAFSATSSAIPANLTGGFTLNMQQTVAPAVKTNDVSSGFQFRTASTDKSSAVSSAFTFATPLAEKTNSGSGAFTFNTQAPQKTAFQNVSSVANPTCTTAGFKFGTPASNVTAASNANFQFSGAGKTNSSNGGLQFSAASMGKIGVRNDSARAADKLGGGVFTFAPPATNQSTNGTSGSQFSSPAAGKPSGIGMGVFQFNSTPAAAHKPNTSGGFQFTAPTARNGNSNAEGFKLNAPAINNPSGGVGFTFPAPKSEKPNSVGTGFQFTAPATSNMVSSFNFNNAVSSANTTQSGGFVFNPTLPLSNNNVGFNFAAQNTPANFNFGKLCTRMFISFEPNMFPKH